MTLLRSGSFDMEQVHQRGNLLSLCVEISLLQSSLPWKFHISGAEFTCRCDYFRRRYLPWSDGVFLKAH